MNMIINPAFRYLPKPSVPALVHIRSCGHYWIPERDWHDRKIRKHFLQLYWGIRGSAVLKHENREYLLTPETVCFYLPGDLHDLSLKESPLEYCWLTFDGDDLDHLIRTFRITREPRPAGPCPTELFQSLELDLHNYAQYGEYMAGADGYKILSLAFAGRKQENSLTERFRQLVAERLSDNGLTPAGIAAALGIHPTTLTRNIRASMGITPLEYIIAYRLQQAMSLIRTTGSSFKEIAQDTGFANANYFAKVFRRKFGCSPSEFRNGTESGMEPARDPGHGRSSAPRSQVHADSDLL